MITGVVLKELVVYQDERGSLFEILRSDEKIFRKFGQAYITVCKSGWVKGFHYHKKQCDYFCVVKGKARIVLCDRRKRSFNRIIEEYILSAQKPQLLRIPPGVVHGFECINNRECWILNLPSLPYNRFNPDEYRLPLNSKEISYRPWKNRKGW